MISRSSRFLVVGSISGINSSLAELSLIFRLVICPRKSPSSSWYVIGCIISFTTSRHREKLTMERRNAKSYRFMTKESNKPKPTKPQRGQAGATAPRRTNEIGQPEGVRQPGLVASDSLERGICAAEESVRPMSNRSRHRVGSNS